jgi:hypothetical protein
VELAQKLDLIDFEGGAKIAGHGFYFLRNEAVLLELALQQFATRLLVSEGFTPVITPDLAFTEILQGTGYIPRGPETQIYSIEFRVRYIFDGPSRFVRDTPFDGFAGQGDALLGINGSGPILTDWKTSNSRPDVDKKAEWVVQLGGYRLGMRRDVDIEPEGGLVVCARRLAPVEVLEVDRPQLQAGSQDFLDRCDAYVVGDRVCS